MECMALVVPMLASGFLAVGEFTVALFCINTMLPQKPTAQMLLPGLLADYETMVCCTRGWREIALKRLNL